MLAFEVEYLLGRSFSGSYLSRDRGEWPPHPSRFFSALVAASHSHGTPAGARLALEWLERQPPPSIHAPAAEGGERVIAFVPPNYVSSKQPRSFPSCFLNDPTVYFVWSGANPDTETRAHLAALAGTVGYLGRSPSLVRVALCENPPAANFEPDPEGEESFRVPAQGRLEELDEVFQNNLRPTPGARESYRETISRPSVPRSSFGDLVILRKTSGFPMPLAGTLVVTEHLRKDFITIADARNLNCPAIHGHDEGSLHVAYVALPFVGAPHADGRILGVAIVIPRVLDQEQKKRVRAAAMLFDKLHIGSLGSWELSVDGDDWPANLRARTWTNPSRIWATATPVLLDRFPKKNLPVEAIVMESCRRIGLPDPVVIQHGLYPMMSGVPTVPEFKLQRKDKPRAEWGVHVKLTFAEAVRGPILLGRGRFFGMGLLRPLVERAE